MNEAPYSDDEEVIDPGDAAKELLLPRGAKEVASTPAPTKSPPAPTAVTADGSHLTEGHFHEGDAEPVKGGKVLITGHAYYRRNAFAEPDHVPFIFERKTEIDEEWFAREGWATEAWSELPRPWTLNVGMLVIKNLADPRAEPEKTLEVAFVTPVPEEKDRDMHSPPRLRPLPLVPHVYVPPGESLPPFYPADYRLVVVRCSQGKVKYKVFAAPR